MQSRSCQIILVTEQLGLLNAKVAKEGLEPCDGKLSCPVLRGLGAGNSPRLPGVPLDSFFSRLLSSAKMCVQSGSSSAIRNENLLGNEECR